MSDTCIVCLGDLGDGASERSPPTQSTSNSGDGEGANGAERQTIKLPRSDAPSKIAHLLPCGHNLHNDCLTPWVERANSCPICRQSFNSVELSDKVGGPVLSTYTVEDRTQVADIDPSMYIEELDDEPDSQPCPVCGDDNNEDLLLLCDGCDAAYHTYCVGLDAVPAGHWFCDTCESQRALDPYPQCPPEQRRSHNRSDRRTRGQARRARNQSQAHASDWERVWQSVWDRLNIDLNSPYSSSGRRAREWRRRYQVAERQGGANRFRDTESTLLDDHRSGRRGLASRPPHRVASPEPETLDELRAWHDLERARELEANPSSNRRKRKSTTTSPVEPGPSQPERRLKRPRTRRLQDLADSSDNAAESSRRRSTSGRLTQANRQTQPESSDAAPSFLQSLLREVEDSSAPKRNGAFRPSPITAITPSEQASPRPSSPALSPSASNHSSPRASSSTPPPYGNGQPSSPTPLTSSVQPVFPPAEFSPTRSPPDTSAAYSDHSDREVGGRKSSTHRGFEDLSFASRARRDRDRDGPKTFSELEEAMTKQQGSNSLPHSPPPSRTRSHESSPTRAGLSLSAKSDVQKLVSAALKPRYKNQEISKEEYTQINRDVSRMLYDKIGDIAALDQDARNRWEKVADDEVSRAIHTLKLVEAVGLGS